MWTQIVGTLFFLVIATYLVQLFVPRSNANPNPRRATARGDIAPLVGFIGLLLLGLSVIEAIRRVIFEVWALSLVLGVVLGIVFWIVSSYRSSMPMQRSRSALVATFLFLRSYGIPIILAVTGVYLGVRIFGSVVEILVAGAGGVLLLVIAWRIFIGTGQSLTKG